MSALLERLRPGGGFHRTGHRGARGLAPENTLASFQRAVDEGVDALELDVRLSADNELVVMHDASVARTTDGDGLVAALPWAQLRELDAGYAFDPAHEFPLRGQGVKIPLLREVLESYPEHLFTVELKEVPQPDVVPRVIELVRRLAPGRVILASFAQELLEEVRQLAPEIPTNLSNREIRRFLISGWVGLSGWIRSPGRVLQVPTHSNHEHGTGIRVITPRLIRDAHRSGRSVQAWTINDPATIRSLIAMGVDGITTDRPDVLNRVLSELP